MSAGTHWLWKDGTALEFTSNATALPPATVRSGRPFWRTPGRPPRLPRMTDWRAHLLESPEAIAALLRCTRCVAVLGIKPESHAGQPAYEVPWYVAQAGFRVVPVPTYFPDVTEILAAPVHRTVVSALTSAGCAAASALVDVFRRPQDIPAHLPDLLAARPAAVWFQLGIRHDAAAETLARAGIDVVQDRCLKVELQRLGR